MERIRQVVLETTEEARRAARRFNRYQTSFARDLTRVVGAASDRAVVLEGPRRVGKSVALKQLVAHLTAEGAPAFYCALDDIRLAGTSLFDAVSAVESLVSRPAWLVLDEVHYDKEWARGLKTAVDRSGSLRIVVASSCGSILASGLREDLRGRTDRLRAEPLSFPDWRAFREAHDVAPASVPEARAQELDSYLRLGGFPEVATMPTVEPAHDYLRQNVADYSIAHDVARALSLRNSDGTRRLLEWCITSSGRRLSQREAAEVAGASTPTTQGWLAGLVDTGLIWELQPYSERKRTRAQYKVYAVDPGLVAAVSRPTAPSVLPGRLLETAVAQALRLYSRSIRGDLSFYVKKQVEGEADFVLETRAGRMAIEVTIGDGAKKPARLVRRAREIGASRFVVIAHRTTGTSLRFRPEEGNEVAVPVLAAHEALPSLAEGSFESPVPT